MATQTTFGIIEMALKGDPTVTDATRQEVRAILEGKREKVVPITGKEACEILGCCRKTLENYERRGLLKPLRITSRKIRFNRAEVEGLLCC